MLKMKQLTNTGLKYVTIKYEKFIKYLPKIIYRSNLNKASVIKVYIYIIDNF